MGTAVIEDINDDDDSSNLFLSALLLLKTRMSYKSGFLMRVTFSFRRCYY